MHGANGSIYWSACNDAAVGEMPRVCAVWSDSDACVDIAVDARACCKHGWCVLALNNSYYYSYCLVTVIRESSQNR